MESAKSVDAGRLRYLAAILRKSAPLRRIELRLARLRMIPTTEGWPRQSSPNLDEPRRPFFRENKQTGMLHRLLHTGTCSSVVREAGKPNWTRWSNRHGWARFDPDAVRFRTYSSTSGHPVRLRLCIHRVPPLCSTVYCHLLTVGELPACLASECSWCACQNWQQEVVL